MKLIFWLFFLSILVIQGCANKPVSLRPDVKPDYLELCVDFFNDMGVDDKLLHLDAVNSFIDEYNAKNPYYEIRSCVNANKSLLGKQVAGKQKNKQVRLSILNTHYIRPSEQVLYVAISGVGLYALVNLGYGLVWAGMSTTAVGVALSDDIAGQPKTVYRQFSSWPYLHRLPEVKRRHMIQFKQFMFELFEELSLSQKQNQSNQKNLKVENQQ